eukprot:TRINITY_DN6563_c0_g2_i1.p1 TRINITY_DN6563_c0_g2~~TRINITY_DN6563_c0_g2_i1.p1  ORF type:complete len:727 (+),score=176.77 TRINITY_DN6563_c0_g2_i1:168-2348(+)
MACDCSIFWCSITFNGILFVINVLCMVKMTLLKRKWRKSRHRTLDIVGDMSVIENEHQKAMQEGNQVPLVAEDKLQASWMIRFHELKFKKVIGKGNVGIVYDGVWGGTRVAIKKLHSNWCKNKDMVERFRTEIELMSHLHHPNVLMFLGAVIAAKIGHLCLVTELCANGNLFEFLHSEAKMTWRMRLAMACDVARGMDYMHRRAGIIQRDLKTANLLVNDHYNIKIADFGLSRTLAPKGRQMETYCGTPANMAPEIVRQEHYSEKADVFSFAIILWELLTRKEPYKESEDTVDGIALAYAVANGKRPNIPPYCPEEYCVLMQRCWETDPSERPSFDEIFVQIKNMQDLVKKAARRVNRQRTRIEMVEVADGATGTHALGLPTVHDPNNGPRYPNPETPDSGALVIPPMLDTPSPEFRPRLTPPTYPTPRKKDEFERFVSRNPKDIDIQPLSLARPQSRYFASNGSDSISSNLLPRCGSEPTRPSRQSCMSNDSIASVAVEIDPNQIDMVIGDDSFNGTVEEVSEEEIDSNEVEPISICSKEELGKKRPRRSSENIALQLGAANGINSTSGNGVLDNKYNILLPSAPINSTSSLAPSTASDNFTAKPISPTENPTHNKHNLTIDTTKPPIAPFHQASARKSTPGSKESKQNPLTPAKSFVRENSTKSNLSASRSKRASLDSTNDDQSVGSYTTLERRPSLLLFNPDAIDDESLRHCCSKDDIKGMIG